MGTNVTIKLVNGEFFDGELVETFSGEGHTDGLLWVFSKGKLYNIYERHILWLRKEGEALPWPGYCQNCQAPLSPPNSTTCHSCGQSDVD
jgi:hypothetical protein